MLKVDSAVPPNTAKGEIFSLDGSGDPRQRTRKPINIVAWIRAILWDGLTLPLVGIICFAVSAEGAMNLVPGLAQKLYKVPLFHGLRYYEGLHRLSLGHIYAVLAMIAVWRSWVFIFKIVLDGERHFKKCRFNPVIYTRIIGAMGISMILCDALIFYLGVAATQSWGWGSGLSFPAVIATVFYVAVLVFVSYMSFALEHQLEREE